MRPEPMTLSVYLMAAPAIILSFLPVPKALALLSLLLNIGLFLLTVLIISRPSRLMKEKLFRGCIGLSLLCFFVQHMLHSTMSMVHLPPFPFFENGFYLMGHVMAWFAVGSHFQPESGRDFPWPAYLLWLGVTVFLAGLVAYTLLLPSQYAPRAIHYGSLSFFPISSGALALVCLLSAFGLGVKNQGRMIFMFGLGALFWFFKDLILFLDFHLEWELQYLAGGLNVLAFTPFAAMGQQTMIMNVEAEEKNDRVIQLSFVWGLALLFPCLHFVVNRLGLLPLDTLHEREWVTLGVSLCLGGLGLLQNGFFKSKSLTLQSKNDMADLHQTTHNLEVQVEEDQALLSKVGNSLRQQIVKRQEVEKALKQSQERFRVLVDTMNEGLYVVNERWEITYVNMALCRMLGYDEVGMSGKNIRFFFDEEKALILAREQDKSKAGRDDIYEISWKHREGYEVPTMISPRGIRSGKGVLKGAFAVVTDISEQKRVQEEMRIMAQYDALTTLPNRTLLNEKLEQAIIRARRYNQQLAVLYMDLDRFKRINDSLGHRVGDLLLLSTAMRLKNGVRGLDTVARLNGDEFIVILSDIENSMAVVMLIEKIQETFRAPFNIEGYEISITPSIGVSIFPNDGHDPAALIKNADAAMYHVKTQGRNNYQFYTREMNEAALHRLNLENRLRLALEQKELQLYYQPKLDLKTRTITGVEALARWRHPELGLIVPDKFIPVAEDTGLILPLGEWVMEEACRQAKEWQDQGLPPIKVAINLSPMQFGSETLPAQVVSALAKSNLQPEFMELEITESLVMEDAERTIRLLAHLKAMGIHLTIDDFGTGYSSLNYLKQFPIDSMKIDRCFVREMETNSSDEAIVRAVIAMSHGMNMTVIAEGVEKKEHLDHLTALGCDYAQGFYISQPLDIDALKALVLTRDFGEPPR